MSSWQRTHTCDELREEHVDKVVTLNGWVNSYRAHPDQIFLDLRDRYGITQVVVSSDDADIFALAQTIRSEWVLSVHGKVRHRLPGKTNDKLNTGAIEIKADRVDVLNRCPTPPFEVTEFVGETLANEDLRLQYRYLDLRRKSLQEVMILRHRVCKVIRDFLDTRNFLEIETPLLGRSTPEGARDYLVPSRLFEEQWYALPQSPQLYKQLLMIAGYDRYFQIARCLRDEDLRANRQPEFTQLDLEMSFVEMDDIFNIIDGLTADVFQQCIGVEVQTPIPKLSYKEAMRRFGSDKPDLRFGMEIIDICEVAKTTEFKVFHDTLERGGVIRGLNAKSAAGSFSRKNLDDLTKFVQGYGAKGMAWIKVEEEKFTSPIEKFLSAESQQALRKTMEAEPGDLLLFVADKENVVCDAVGGLRTHLGLKLNLYDPDAPVYKMAWIVDFPLFFFDEEENRWVSNHHPFTAPVDEDIPLLESDPGKVRAKAYDLAINGDECGGGSIRIHNPELQSKVFSVLGMNLEQGKSKFGFLLDALTFGAPPHGGIALGLDRWIMMLARTTNIRDVIAFPKNQRARDLMTGAPAEVDKKQLKELGLG